MANALPALDRDPLFDVIALEPGDSRFRVFVPDESSLQGVEYAIVTAPHVLVEDYFEKPLSDSKTPRWCERELCGRVVKLYGITEDEAFQEFRKAFHIDEEDLVVPVVNNVELAKVIDDYIVRELTSVFKRSPKLPASYVRPKVSREMTEEERDLLELEKTVQIIESIRKRCLPLMEEVLAYQELIEILEGIPREIRASFLTVIHLLKKRINIFQTIVASPKKIDNISAYTSLDTIEFVLGEEMLKRVKKMLPIIWKLPRDQVHRVHRFVECKVRELQERTLVGSHPSRRQVDSALVDQIRAPFSQFLYIRDYYLRDEFLPLLLDLVHMPLRPYPRLETVKAAFESYVQIEKLVHYSSEPLFRLLAWAKKKSAREKEAIVSALEGTSSWQDVECILRKYQFPIVELTADEQEIFVLFFTILLPEENEILMSTVPAFLEDEVEDVLDLMIGAVERGKEEVDVLLEEPPPREHLLDIEFQAKNILDQACSKAKVRLVYRPLWGGRKIEMGAFEMEERDFNKYYQELLRGQSQELI